MPLVFDLTTGQFCENECSDCESVDALEPVAPSACNNELGLRLQEYTHAVTERPESMPSEIAASDVAQFIRRMSRKAR